MVQNFVTVIAAFLLAFLYGSWKMSLLLIGVMPLVSLAFMIQMKVIHHSSNDSQKNVEESGKIAVQAIR